MTAIEEIKQAVGPKGYTEDIRVMAPYLADWRGNFSGNAAIVVMPKSTAEVSAVVKICASNRIAMDARYDWLVAAPNSHKALRTAAHKFVVNHGIPWHILDKWIDPRFFCKGL